MEGEGCYLYDKNTGKILELSLANRDEFLAGKRQSEWKKYFDFLSWYLE
jgi:hypothetical protein